VGDPVDRVRLQAHARGGVRVTAAAGDAGVRVDDAVHHEQRVVAAQDRGVATDLHLDPAAGRAGVRLEVHAGDLAGQGIQHRGRRDTVDLLAGDVRDGGRRTTPVDGGGLAGHDEGVEVQRVDLEADLDVGRPRLD